MTATTVPAELPISEARPILADIATAAKEHYAQTMLTRHGKPVAKVVHPDAGVTPGPELWQAAQEAYDRIVGSDWYRQLPLAAQSALAALAALPRAYYGYDQGPARTCGLCGTTVTRSGTHWVDGEGWDHCDGTSTSHEPVQED